MIAKQIISALEQLHDPHEWGFFEELRIGTGYGKDSEQRLDAWAIHYFPSKRNVTRCYEIKVSKSDFLNEIRQPLKRRPGLRLANEFYFVAPKGMLAIEDIPVECGLMEVDENGIIETTINAPFRDIMPPTWLFLAAISRRCNKDKVESFNNAKSKTFLEKITSTVALSIIDDHVKKWRDHIAGSREMPDRLLQEVVDIKEEIIHSLHFEQKHIMKSLSKINK